MAPGPTPVPPEVFLAQGSPLVYHRGPGYGDLLREVTESLQRAAHTSNDLVIFASSGTGGLESSVANLLSPGDRVVVPVAGYFGERFAKIARAYGADVRTVDYPWGSALGEVCRTKDVLFVVDVISSLGAVPYDGDGWGVDVAIGGSQKALSASPGISFVSVSQRAWERGA